MSFSGKMSYCRLPNYAKAGAPLSAMIHGKGLTAHDKVTWTDIAHKAFTNLKLALQQTPTLGLPDPHKPLVQTVDCRHGFMTSVLLQEHGGKHRVVAYFSSKLDSVAAGLPLCLRAVAAAEKAVLVSKTWLVIHL